MVLVQKIYQPIYKRLSEIRVYNGYSQSEIAKLLKVGKSVYANWEINKRLIPLKNLADLANIYNINIDYLVGLSNRQENMDSFKIDTDIISNNLRLLMVDNNLNIKEFSSLIKYSERAIHYYLNKERLIPTYVIYDIARIFDISIDYLLGRSSIKTLE